MIEAQPGCPALLKTFHIAAIIRTTMASEMIRKIGLAAWGAGVW